MDKNLLTIGKIALTVLILALVAATGWSSYENSRIVRPLQELRESEDRFKEVKAEAAFCSFGDPGRIRFNIKQLENPGNIAPVLLLIGYAKKMNNHTFKQVELQYGGKTKFLMDGNNFKRIGIQAQIDKPEKVAIEIPPLLKKPNGLSAFNEPFGDEQWVSQKQIKNLRDFMMEWYVNDWVEDKKKEHEKAPQASPTASPAESPAESPSAIPTSGTGDNPGGTEITPEPTESPETPAESPSASPGEKDIPVIEPEEL